jgi:two-component system, OmpR family, response regulator MprA
MPQVRAVATGPRPVEMAAVTAIGGGDDGRGSGATDSWTSSPVGPDRSDGGVGAPARLPSWADASVLRYGDLALDPRTRLVRRGARGVELSRREFDLLALLVDHARMVLTREVIYDRVWGYGFGTTSNTLSVHVRSLRRKLESGGEPRLIQTVHGVGYVLRD